MNRSYILKVGLPILLCSVLVSCHFVERVIRKPEPPPVGVEMALAKYVAQQQTRLAADLPAFSTLTPASQPVEPVFGRPTTFHEATLKTLRVVYCTFCDRCGAPLASNNPDVLLVLFNAEGWKVLEDGTVLCDICVGRTIVSR